MLFSFLVLFLITACYPCKFLDWNCNQGLADTPRWRKIHECQDSQLNQALKTTTYSKLLHKQIINECIRSDGNYKYSSK